MKQKNSLLTMLKSVSFCKIVFGVCVGVSMMFFSYGQALTIVDRAGRGADESLRYNEHPYWVALRERLAQQPSTPSSGPSETTQAIRYLRATYPDLYTIDTIIDRFLGNELWYKQYYTDTKRQIILHHTAEIFPEDADTTYQLEQIRKIYSYHTQNRRFGDIGYHYIIGPDGTVYEGRAGGKGVIGTHTSFNNSFSVGVALMGNFDVQKPTAAQIASTKELVALLVQEYAIDPDAQVIDHIKSSKYPFVTPRKNVSIIGHTHAGQTACPGDNFLPYLDNIRAFARQTEAGFIGWDEGDSASPHSDDNLHENDVLPVLPPVSLSQAIVSDVSLIQAKELSREKFLIDMSALATLDTFLIKTSGNIRLKNETLTGPVTLTYSNNTYRVTHASGVFMSPYVLFLGDITIENYAKASYLGVPRNEFDGMTIFVAKKVFNIVSLEQYLQGILVANDSDPKMYNHLMALSVKNHLLIQRSQSSLFSDIATDYIPPYVGAGLEKTLVYRPAYIQESLAFFAQKDGKIVTLPFGKAGLSHNVLEERSFSAHSIDSFVQDMYGYDISLSEL